MPKLTNAELVAAQAAGLRALADFIEANPHLADEMRYPLATILTPVNSAPDPRAMLADFGTAAHDHDGVTTMDSYNAHPDYAGLTLHFGPAVRLQVYASREKLFAKFIDGVPAEQAPAPMSVEWRVPAELAELGVTA
jgi:hypothetical protein